MEELRINPYSYTGEDKLIHIRVKREENSDLKIEIRLCQIDSTKGEIYKVSFCISHWTILNFKIQNESDFGIRLESTYHKKVDFDFFLRYDLFIKGEYFEVTEITEELNGKSISTKDGFLCNLNRSGFKRGVYHLDLPQEK